MRHQAPPTGQVESVPLMLLDASDPPLITTFLRHYDMLVEHVRRHVVRHGGDSSTASDVVQELCVQLIEAPPAQPVHTPLAFLRSVATRRVIDHHRVSAGRAAWVQALDEPGMEAQVDAGAQAQDPAQIVAGRQQLLLLADAVQQLPPRCREVFVLHKIHELPQAEVAARLGISLKAVEKHLRLGVASCREALERDPQQLQPLFPLGEAAPAKRSTRRVAGAVASLSGVCAAIWLAWADPALQRVQHVSGIAQRQEIALSDGSRVLLDADSRLEVVTHLRSRQVVLAQGRARFTVEPSWRPFIVEAAETRVRVVGTVFDVGRRGQQVGVTVLRGKVAVSSIADPCTRALLGPGQGLLTAPGPQGLRMWTAPAEVDGSRSAWTEGRLVFRRTPLRDAVAEMQRYHLGTIRLQGKEVEQLQVTGVFDAQRTEQALALLPRILPVRVTLGADGAAEIGAR